MFILWTADKRVIEVPTIGFPKPYTPVPPLPSGDRAPQKEVTSADTK
jgi:hypothetical protein